MSDTPRTEIATWHSKTPGDPLGMDVVCASFAKSLERELNAANTQIGLLVSGSKQQERQIEFLQARVSELEAELDSNGRVLHSIQTERDNALALLGVYKIERDELKTKIQRLVEAGDKAIENIYYRDRVNFWTKSKEGL